LCKCTFQNKKDMGLTFHYSGKIRDHKHIDLLVEEVADLCKGLNWKYTVVGDEKIKGIIVDAPDSEPLWFTFTPDGKTCDVVNLQYSDPADEFYSLCHTKTQYAGPAVHMTLIKMLRYMSDKYYSEIEVMDEGEFWETGNEQNLREIFTRYTALIDAFAEKLEKMERIPGESTEELVDRIEQAAKEMGEVEIIRVENPDFKKE
jgi:hypothetical protein